MEVVLLAACKDPQMNCRNWVITHLKHVIPTSVNDLVDPETGILDKKALKQRLGNDGMLPGPSAMQALILSEYLMERHKAIKDITLFCIGIGLHPDRTNGRLRKDGSPGQGWNVLMREQKAEKQKYPSDPRVEKLNARLKRASEILLKRASEILYTPQNPI